MFLAAVSSSVQTYGGEGGRIAAEANDQASALPSTGFELALIFGVGLFLFGMGMLLAKLN